MNVILLMIWICVFILGVLNFYYNNSIITNYQIYNQPKQPPSPPNTCIPSNIKTVDKKSLTTCGDGFIYSVNGQDYKITTYQASYSKVCSHFCDKILNNGRCTSDTQTQKYNTCESLFKPDKGCNSSLKPAVYVQDDTSKTLYYPEAPIVQPNLCSSS